MKSKIKKIIISIFVLVAILGLYILIENQIITVDNVTMKHKDLPSNFQGYKILQISDLHGRSFGKNQKRLINKINELEYDLILFTGDYINSDKLDLNPLENLLKGIKNDIPKYYVLGNSDEDSEIYSLVRGNKFVDLFSKYNVKSLDNEGVQIKKDNQSIWLTPREYYLYENGEDTITEMFKDIEGNEKEIEVSKLEKELELKKYEFSQKYESEENPFTINVEHRGIEIDYFQDYLSSMEEMQSEKLEDGWGMTNRVVDWDMSISGHTHGGQVRVPFIGAVASPNAGLFPGEMNIKGVHYYDERVQYVNSGLGASGPKILRFRVFNPPSIGLIELKNK